MFPTPEHTREMERYQPQMYPHYIPSRGFVMPYFGANPFLGAPPSSMAAKLLYVARREVQGIAAPPAPYVPATRATAPPTWRGSTAEDYLVLNAAKGALTPKRTRWDWNKGYCRVVGSQQVEGQGPGDASSKKHDVIIWDGNELGETDGDDDDDKEDRRPHREESELEDSRRWDTLWWRMRLCNNIYSAKPRFEAGSVYDPGCMRGSWRGKIYVSDHLSCCLMTHGSATHDYPFSTQRLELHSHTNERTYYHYESYQTLSLLTLFILCKFLTHFLNLFPSFP